MLARAEGSHNLVLCISAIFLCTVLLDGSLLICETVIASDDAARAADPIDEAADVADLGDGGTDAHNGRRDQFHGRRPHVDFLRVVDL